MAMRALPPIRRGAARARGGGARVSEGGFLAEGMSGFPDVVLLISMRSFAERGIGAGRLTRSPAKALYLLRRLYRIARRATSRRIFGSCRNLWERGMAWSLTRGPRVPRKRNPP